jgi:hypothetical protein
MSKLRKTPLTKFIDVIKENEDCFEDKGFYNFLLNVGTDFLEKEKKAISKAYDSGFSDCNSITKNERVCVDGSTYFGLRYSDKSKTSSRAESITSSIQSLIETLGKLNELEKSLIEKESNDIEEPVTENDSKIQEFCKTLSENPISVNQNSEVSSEQQVEELLIKRLQEVGIEPKSVRIVKL